MWGRAQCEAIFAPNGRGFSCSTAFPIFDMSIASIDRDQNRKLSETVPNALPTFRGRAF